MDSLEGLFTGGGSCPKMNSAERKKGGEKLSRRLVQIAGIRK